MLVSTKIKPFLECELKIFHCPNLTIVFRLRVAEEDPLQSEQAVQTEIGLYSVAPNEHDWWACPVLCPCTSIWETRDIDPGGRNHPEYVGTEQSVRVGLDQDKIRCKNQDTENFQACINQWCVKM